MPLHPISRGVAKNKNTTINNSISNQINIIIIQYYNIESIALAKPLASWLINFLIEYLVIYYTNLHRIKIVSRKDDCIQMRQVQKILEEIGMSTLSKILETYSIIKTEVARLQMR